MPPLDEMTVGIIGCGRIGTAVAAMLAPMVAQVLIYDPMRDDGGPPGTERVDHLDDLLARSRRGDRARSAHPADPGHPGPA